MSTTANLGMTLPAGTNWADIAVLNANFELIDAAMGAARAAEPYSAAKTYAVGDYCTRDGALFKCTVAITAPEAWTAGHWKATSIGAEFKAIYASLSNKADTGYLISPDLNDVRASGIYRFNTPENGPDFSYGHLLVMSFNHGNGDTCFQLACDIARDKISFRRGNALDGASPTWTNWTDIAVATPPEEYDLPLVAGWETITGAYTKYRKNQFNEVSVNFLLKSTVDVTDGMQIATIPLGYRPSYTVSSIVILTMSDWSDAYAHIDINANGNINLWGAPTGKQVLRIVGTSSFVAGN